LPAAVAEGRAEASEHRALDAGQARKHRAGNGPERSDHREATKELQSVTSVEAEGGLDYD